ncbi:MAG: phosphatidate cytidylyltransferase [Bacteroidia bacterium]|nr:phosphatidate cytidylyltransferase [Bacteroidia bacterium]
MKTLIIRTITGIFFIAILISGIAVNTYTFLIVFLAVMIATMWEFYRISLKERIRAQLYLGVLLGILIFISNYLYARELVDAKIFVPLFPFAMFVLIHELYHGNKRPFSNIAYTYFGIIYISIPLSLFNYFVNRSGITGIVYSPGILLGFFFLLWTYDTIAYVAGILFGRHGLFPRISPKKTWEGVIGGTIITWGLAYLLSFYFEELGVRDWLVIATIIVIFGTFGDLVESMFKRSINIKDTGNILPGHGGFLDRFDATLLASPFVYAYLELFVF